MYRSAVQQLAFTFSSLGTTFSMAFQAVFLMAAFHASLNLKPALEPTPEAKVEYEHFAPYDGGMALQLKYVLRRLMPARVVDVLDNAGT